MTAWIQIFERPLFCAHNKLAQLAFSLALGSVYLFTYILAVEGRTRYKYTVYYTICLLQNVACGTIWYIFVEDNLRYSEYHLPLLLLTVVPYLVGLIIMVVYYSFFHPKVRKGIKDITVSFKAGEQLTEVRQ